MTKLEQQVAEILEGLRVENVARGDTSRTVQAFLREVVAPRVAAAIDLIGLDGLGAEQGLGALRGEPF